MDSKKALSFVVIALLIVVVAGAVYAVNDSGHDDNEVDTNVTYHGNGGTCLGFDDYTDERYEGVSKCLFENGDLRFSHWNTVSDDSGDSYYYCDSASDEKLKSGSVTHLYAIWYYELDAEFDTVSEGETSYEPISMKIAPVDDPKFMVQDFDQGVWLDPSASKVRITLDSYAGASWDIDEQKLLFKSSAAGFNVELSFSDMEGLEFVCAEQSADGIVSIDFAYSGNASVTVHTSYIENVSE